MFDKVVSVISVVANIDSRKIKPDSNILTDLGLCSLDILSLALKIEAEFNINIPDRDFSSFLIVKDIVSYINERLEIH